MKSIAEYILDKQANNPFFAYTPDRSKLSEINKALDATPIMPLLNQRPLTKEEFFKRS